jgi:hypothetical protein
MHAVNADPHSGGKRDLMMFEDIRLPALLKISQRKTTVCHPLSSIGIQSYWWESPCTMCVLPVASSLACFLILVLMS